MTDDVNAPDTAMQRLRKATAAAYMNIDQKPFRQALQDGSQELTAYAAWLQAIHDANSSWRRKNRAP